MTTSPANETPVLTPAPDEVRCRCELDGRPVEGGYRIFHYIFDDHARCSRRCWREATEEDGLCDDCRAEHP